MIFWLYKTLNMPERDSEVDRLKKIKISFKRKRNINKFGFWFLVFEKRYLLKTKIDPTKYKPTLNAKGHNISGMDLRKQ
jgi:hypothetical protein